MRDEPVATIIADTLNKFASGILGSQAEVKRHFEAHPGFPKTSSGRIGKSRVREIMLNPLYAGFLSHQPWGIALTKARHEPLISFATHQKIINRLHQIPQAPIRLDVNPDYPLRGLVKCADCHVALRAGRSKGRSKYYHYYGCQTPQCSSYGKSIKKEKIEGEFNNLLHTVKPAREIMNIATVMFKMIWERHLTDFKTRQKSAQQNLRSLEARINALVDRIVKATQPTLIDAYERELAKLESQRLTILAEIESLSDKRKDQAPNFEDAYRTSMRFLANPCYLWESSHILHKRTAVKLTSGDSLTYDRKSGYRTANLSLPFQIIQRLSDRKEQAFIENEQMVGGNGFEPLTLSV